MSELYVTVAIGSRSQVILLTELKFMTPSYYKNSKELILKILDVYSLSSKTNTRKIVSTTRSKDESVSQS